MTEKQKGLELLGKALDKIAKGSYEEQKAEKEEAEHKKFVHCHDVVHIIDSAISKQEFPYGRKIVILDLRESIMKAIADDFKKNEWRSVCLRDEIRKIVFECIEEDRNNRDKKVEKRVVDEGLGSVKEVEKKS